MRCYNGCPDGELQRLLDNTEKMKKRVTAIEPEAHCTHHFPDGFVVHVWGKEISAYRSSPIVAWEDALARLQGGKL